MLLSVIVPVYNGEKYLSECLNSLSNQGLNEQDYEVIVVNDGSTDGTESIIDSFCMSPIFKKVNKNNGGVSSARNLGVQKSGGGYITFVDADDKIVENTYNSVLSYMIENELDVYSFGIERQSEKLLLGINSLVIKQNSSICVKMKLRGIGGIVYRKKILTDNQIVFDTTVSYTEDLLFNFFFSQNAKRVGHTQLALYYYRYNTESTTLSLFTNKNTYGNKLAKEYKHYLSLFSFVSKIKEYYLENSDNTECDYLISVMTGEILWASVRSFYEPAVILKDIKANGLSLNDIKMKHIKGNSLKAIIRSCLRYLLKYPIVYKTISCGYRKMKV